MRKLLSLLLAALVLLSVSLAPARADEDENGPAAEPPAAEAPAAPEEEAPAAPAAPEEEAPAAPAAPEEEAPAAPAAPEEEAPAAPAAPEEEAPAAPAAPEEEAPAAPAAPAEEAPAAPAAPEEEAPEPTADAPASPEEPAEQEEPAPTETPDETPKASEKAHNKPRRKKSLAYWEQEELPALTLTGDLRTDILTIARSQLGYSADSSCYEEDKNGNRKFYTRYGEWDGATYSQWCDTFVSFCVYYGGFEGYPKNSSCGRHMQSLKKAGYWREWNSYVPKKGDLVFFAFDTGSMKPNHVAIVEEVIPGSGNRPGSLVTIEGNQSNPEGGMACVRRMTRSLDRVVGYGTYEKGKTYPEGYGYRSDGWWIVEEDSGYFVEYPTREAMAFLGLVGSRYYAYWFPETPEESPAPQEEAERPEGDELDPRPEGRE